MYRLNVYVSVMCVDGVKLGGEGHYFWSILPPTIRGVVLVLLPSPGFVKVDGAVGCMPLRCIGLAGVARGGGHYFWSIVPLNVVSVVEGL